MCVVLLLFVLNNNQYKQENSVVVVVIVIQYLTGNVNIYFSLSFVFVGYSLWPSRVLININEYTVHISFCFISTSLLVFSCYCCPKRANGFIIRWAYCFQMCQSNKIKKKKLGNLHCFNRRRWPLNISNINLLIYFFFFYYGNIEWDWIAFDYYYYFLSFYACARVCYFYKILVQRFFWCSFFCVACLGFVCMQIFVFLRAIWQAWYSICRENCSYKQLNEREIIWHDDGCYYALCVRVCGFVGLCAISRAFFRQWFASMQKQSFFF